MFTKIESHKELTVTGKGNQREIPYYGVEKKKREASLRVAGNWYPFFSEEMF